MPDPRTMDLVQIAYEFKKHAKAYGKAKQAYLTFVNGYKAKRAQLIAKYRTIIEGASEARLENEALASKEYQEYLDSWDKAAGLCFDTEVDKMAWDRYWESIRTMNANRREEIKHEVQS